jgi:hypothetical protein
MRNICDGLWYRLATEVQFDHLKTYGTMSPTGNQQRSADVQHGRWQGPGWYRMLAYGQHSHRYGHELVHEVLTAEEVANEVCSDIRDMAEVLKQARSGIKPAAAG